MNTLRETKEAIIRDPENWVIHLMDFVDDFRRYKNVEAISEPFELTHERWDALLASTASQLCSELSLPIPPWLWDVPACNDPWFVSGFENLKAIALVESPLHFRRRKIFVLENFLSRV
ncbi:hypothetical protein FBQ87_00250 [Sphingobacteriales bacterium CHB3]|nr:hypothetical protein [Sphingobacteriales bacterium CHB3]